MTGRHARLAAIWLAGFVACPIIGGFIGAGLGFVAPDYYRTVFPSGRSPNFNPLQVGIGLGITQGLAAAVAISLAILAVTVWRGLRSYQAQPDSNPIDREPASWLRWVLWGGVTFIAVSVFSALAFVIGAIVGEQQRYSAETQYKLVRIEKILESQEFSHLRIGTSSAAQVNLEGTLPDDEAHSALFDRLVLALGTDEARAVIRTVDVRP